MIHKKKVITYEVRSHRNCTTLSEKGEVTDTTLYPVVWSKPVIKRAIWHLQDVLKCMRQIEKEKQAKKEQANEDLPGEK